MFGDLQRQAWDDQLFSGCVVGGVQGDDFPELHPIGRHSLSLFADEVAVHHLFDAASLTKSVVTGSLALLALQEGRAQLATPIVALLPELKSPDAQKITLLHLLTQTLDYNFSLAALKDDPPKKILAALMKYPLPTPPGQRHTYCNATSILLGLWLERLWGGKLDALAQRLLFDPLEMRDSTFHPLERFSRHEILPTEECLWRGELVHGTVHDESAHALAPLLGTVGSAGLFTTVPDLQLFCREWLRASRGQGKIFSRETAERVDRNWLAELGVQPETPGASTDTALGFERNQPAWMGSRTSGHAIGKTGFTGCSLVIDFKQQKALAILSNFVFPVRKPRARIDEFRAACADRWFGA